MNYDDYLLHYDFAAYIETLKKAEGCFQNKHDWVKKTILAAASMGKFSSDRSILEYADKVWNVKPLKI